MTFKLTPFEIHDFYTLDNLFQELEESEERYKEIHADQETIKKKYQKEIDELKRRLEEAAADVDFAKKSKHGKLSAKGKENCGI